MLFCCCLAMLAYANNPVSEGVLLVAVEGAARVTQTQRREGDTQWQRKRGRAGSQHPLVGVREWLPAKQMPLPCSRL